MFRILLQIPSYHKPPYRSDPVIERAHWHSQPGTRTILIASPSAKLFPSCWHFLAHCCNTRLALGALEHLSRMGYSVVCELNMLYDLLSGIERLNGTRFLCALYMSLNYPTESNWGHIAQFKIWHRNSFDTCTLNCYQYRSISSYLH